MLLWHFMACDNVLSDGFSMSGKGRPGRRVGRRETGAHQCQTCAHPEGARIDFLLASGAQINAVAEQFGLSRTSVYHHWKKHVSDRYKRIVGSNRLTSFEELSEPLIVYFMII